MLRQFMTRPAFGFGLMVLIPVIVFFNVSQSLAALCTRWSEGEKTGSLDYLQLDEASGIAVSRKFPGRLYHVNDSGSGPYFYISDMDGGNTRAVRIEGFDGGGTDFEDASAGRCFAGKSCFVIADIGDNSRRRKFVEIILIEELESYGHSHAPLKVVKLVYPDRPHNAEGLALHPNGDIYIFTKEENVHDRVALPAKLFRVKKEKWENAGAGEVTLDYVGDLDLSELNNSDSSFGSVITSFDIAPDGKSFLVLTYEDAYEFDIDLSEAGLKPSGALKEDRDYRVIKLTSLPQQESISYVDGGKGFIYDSEYHIFGVPIMRVDCLDVK